MCDPAIADAISASMRPASTIAAAGMVKLAIEEEVVDVVVPEN